jgi:hypothetical protein
MSMERIACQCQYFGGSFFWWKNNKIGTPWAQVANATLNFGIIY